MRFIEVQLVATCLFVVSSVVEAISMGKCNTCDRTKCPDVSKCTREHIIVDMCNCCRVCVTYEELSKPKPTVSGDVCKDFECPRFEMCIMNIQELPVCRCPSHFMCPFKMGTEVCGQDKVTYKSRCHKTVAECQQKRKIKIAYKGKCIENIQAVSDKKLGKITRREFRRLRRRRMCNRLQSNLISKDRKEKINKKYKCWKKRSFTKF